MRFGADRDEPFTTPEQAREWVRDLVDRAKAEEDFEIRQPGIGPTIDSDAGIGN